MATSGRENAGIGGGSGFFRLRASCAAMLTTVFASLYLALGPGSFFTVDEVVVEEMAQAVFQRGTLDVPAMNTAVGGVGGNFYAHRGPALGYAALPLVAVGTLLDDAYGSMKGNTLVGPPVGTTEHPLRWGGRFAIFTALIFNALAGGLAVATLYLIGLNLGADGRASLLMAAVAGLSTLLASEATHFLQHPLEALGLLLAFFFFSDHRSSQTAARRGTLAGLSLGISVLARPNAIPAAAILWAYGCWTAWKRTGRDARRTRELARFVGMATLLPALSALLYLFYNHLQFGSYTDFGYNMEAAEFHFRPGEMVRAVAAYLISPGLGIFVFAPPLLLGIPVFRESICRWAPEAKALLSASAAHLLVFSGYTSWPGGLSYGPRFMLAPMLLLMPLTLPAFERFVQHSSPGWRRAVITLTVAGLVVQGLGLAVTVTANEWYRMQHGINENGAFVFNLSASPILVHLRELASGRNISPWAARAFSQPRGPFVLWLLLVAAVATGYRWLADRYLQLAAENRARDLPGGARDRPVLMNVVLVIFGLLILGGLLSTKQITDPLPQHILQMLNTGLAAQKAGRQVTAQEYYALVLGVEPTNKFALFDLALLYEGAGNTSQAVALYQRALQTDPNFGPAKQNLARFQGAQVNLASTELDPSAVSGACGTPADCFQFGKRFWDAGNKEGALAVWLKGAEMYPQDGSFIRNVARCRYDLGDYPGAVRDYRKVAAMFPDQIGSRTDLAWALLRAKQLEEARALCQEVLSRSPDNADAKAILDQIEHSPK